VGGRAKGKRNLIVTRTDSIRTLALVIVVAGVPILGTVFVTTSTTEPDLAELTPTNPHAGNSLVLGWPALLQNHPQVTDAESRIPAGIEVQALGYMVDGDRVVDKGELVQEFILIPEAGNLLHPAHRIPDQMIAIHLAEGIRIQFLPRALVWVWGRFRVSPGPAVRSKPLYTLDRARAQPANKADIARYFR